MIRSMTGFGRARETVGDKDVTVEIKSVNGRFFDCGVRISREFGYLEERVKPYLQSRGVSRGKVDVFITMERIGGGDRAFGLDRAYLEGYLSALRALRDEYGLRDDVSVMTVAKNPSVFVAEAVREDAEADWLALLPVLGQATDAFLAAREREGEALGRDLAAKLAQIRALTDEIEGLSRDGVAHYRERLAEKIRDALADNHITPDESRLLTECAVYADRVAIDEELVRLRTHFDEMEKILAGGEPVGRRLDFLVQEMNREINTTGSKCGDAAIAHRVVDVKCELEKIREQIQNLE